MYIIYPSNLLCKYTSCYVDTRNMRDMLFVIS